MPKMFSGKHAAAISLLQHLRETLVGATQKRSISFLRRKVTEEKKTLRIHQHTMITNIMLIRIGCCVLLQKQSCLLLLVVAVVHYSQAVKDFFLLLYNDITHIIL